MKLYQSSGTFNKVPFLFCCFTLYQVKLLLPVWPLFARYYLYFNTF
nr:MAG TPA: hypothetical protein [Caudoviricetes sp.]